MWTAAKMVRSLGSDGGRARVPDLKRKGENGREEMATSNEEKSRWMVGEFYPGRSEGATDPPDDTVYPEPMWEYQPLSEKQIQQVVNKLKPYKATRSGTFPNCVYKFCAKLLVPRLYRIFRALDVYRFEPPDWKRTETIVVRKPGKPDYTKVGAHRPLILSHSHARIRNGAKNLQVATNAEIYNMFPKNQFG
ncbi:hypothetical protein B0H16DRAFT_1241576, partial [Mycena metata]